MVDKACFLYYIYSSKPGLLFRAFVSITTDPQNYIKMNTQLFLGNLGTGEIIIIAIVVLLLFGGRKIPELMKGLGKGIKNFKEGVKGIEDDIEGTDNTAKKD